MKIETIDFFESLVAKWIIVDGDINCAEIAKVVENQYELVKAYEIGDTGNLALYHLKE